MVPLERGGVSTGRHWGGAGRFGGGLCVLTVQFVPCLFAWALLTMPILSPGDPQ